MQSIPIVPISQRLTTSIQEVKQTRTSVDESAYSYVSIWDQLVSSKLQYVVQWRNAFSTPYSWNQGDYSLYSCLSSVFQSFFLNLVFQIFYLTGSEKEIDFKLVVWLYNDYRQFEFRWDCSKEDEEEFYLKRFLFFNRVCP